MSVAGNSQSPLIFLSFVPSANLCDIRYCSISSGSRYAEENKGQEDKMAAPRQAVRCLRASTPTTRQFLWGRSILSSSSSSSAASSSYSPRSFSSTSSPLSPQQQAHNNAAASSSSTATHSPDRETHFGFQTVTESEKTERVAEVFTSVAETYDRMNDLMSFGWHRVWK